MAQQLGSSVMMPSAALILSNQLLCRQLNPTLFLCSHNTWRNTATYPKVPTLRHGHEEEGQSGKHGWF